MTVTGHLGVTPDLQRLYTHCAFIPYWWPGEGVIKIEYGSDRRGICSEDILHTTGKAKSRFFNQSSLVFRLRLADGNTQETSGQPAVNLSAVKNACFKEVADQSATNLSDRSAAAIFKETNIKLFKNGGFQMTGVNSEAMARAALQRMIDINWADGTTGIWAEKPRITKFDICMMNSDYNVGAAIRRDRLYKILVEEYGLWSTFEPTIYQGVNTKFFWNSARPANAPPGICSCPQQCEGDGDGHGTGRCKKITISPFRTGSVIITGAKEMRQLEDAYRFFNELLAAHEEDVLRAEAPVAETPARAKRAATLTNAMEILRFKKQSSPRSVIRLPAVAAA
jgi:TATA-box binding protein (TBP) (component of TFIID and TFIIIB)